MAQVFLYAPQDFHNLCLLSRTLEVFGVQECFVFDPEHLIRERYGKSRTRELRAVSSGAFQKITWTRVSEPNVFLDEHAKRGRLVATVPGPNAVPLPTHRFVSTDVVLFGSESRGLPEDVVQRCDVSVVIPSCGVTQSLNLVVAIGIVLYEQQRQGSGEPQMGQAACPLGPKAPSPWPNDAAG